MRQFLLLIPLVVILGIAVWAGFALWRMMPDAGVSGHGYLAMTLGIFFSFLVGGGLMALVFYSNRKGYDDAADRRWTPDEPGDSAN